MPDQNCANSNVTITPINVDRHKNADPNRNPETDVQPPADKKRDNAMTDCPETTVLMRFRQFQEEELLDLADDFDSTHDAQYAKDVWWAFHSAARTMPTQPDLKKAWRSVSEKSLSNAWEKVDSEHHLVPNHFLHISDSHYEATDSSLSKIDGSFIHNSDRDGIRPRYPNWANIALLVEFKRGGTGSDPFDDIPFHGPDAMAKTRVAVRGQIMSYAERLFSYQHRSAVFFLLINSDTFRVMRWDRSGVVVTEAIDYIGSIEGTKALLEVLYAFTKLDRAMQGVDTTSAQLVEGSCGWQRMDILAQPSLHDLDFAEGWFDGPIHEVFWDKKVAATFGCLTGKSNARLHHDPTCLCDGHKKPLLVVPVLSHIRQMFRDSLVAGFPRYRLLVDGQEYLVGKHVFLGFGMVGRGTRGYIALEWKTQRFVFLKDCWRPGYEGVEKEGGILAKLNTNGVLNVPTAIRHEDVVDQEEGETPRRQETEASRFHPQRGDKKVNTGLPPFVETIEPPSEPQKKFMRFVKKGESKPKTEETGPTKTMSAPLPKPNDETRTPDSDTSDPPARGAAASAPELPALGPNIDVPTTSQPPSTLRGTKRKLDAFLAGDKRNPGEGLRHMIHTRLVVKEICLPLTAFTSSQQFVRILYECITAHAMAYMRCGYMHRDVSAGNMLIYPEIVRREDGKFGVYWRGLLTDWELAKHSDTKKAMQPQRTGTWHFMSAYLLLNPNMPTAIADELEAFLHILIYGCIRRVKSSLDSIHEFLTDYFAGGSYDPKHKQAACPSAKQQSIILGHTLKMTTRDIIFTTPDGKVTKQHPLNELISELLEIFHSRYAVLEWEAVSKTIKPPQSPSTRKTGLPDTWQAGYKVVPEGLLGTSKRKKGKATQRVEPPTPEMYDNVEALEDHATIADIFHSFAYSEDHEWPSDDVVPDRQAEPSTEKVRRQASGSAMASRGNVSPIPEVEEPEGVSIHDADKADNLEGGSSIADVPMCHPPPPIHSDPPAVEEHNATTTRTKTGRKEPTVPPERPRKRRRGDPIVQEADASVLSHLHNASLEPPTRRVTRSRSAANAAAAVAAPLAVAHTTRQTATSAQSTRVTRTKSGKLPRKATGVQAGASTSSRGATSTVRGGTRTRATAADLAKAASGPVTRRRAAGTQSTVNQGRQTRRS